MEEVINKRALVPKILLIIGVLAVSTASVFIKFAQEEAGSIVIGAYRLGISTLALLPIVLFRYRKELSTVGRKELVLGAVAGIFLATHFASWITSLHYTSVISSVVLVTTTPLWVALVAPWTLEEPVTRYVVIGLALALTGTVVIGLGDSCLITGSANCGSISDLISGDALRGDFLAVVGAWTAAGYVIIGRRVRATMVLVPYVFIVYGFAAIVLCFTAVFSGEPVIGFSGDTYVWLILLGVIPQLIGHSTFNWALGYLPATFVAITLLGEPIGSSILAYLVLGERPGALTIFGGLVILGGIGIAAFQDNRSNGG